MSKSGDAEIDRMNARKHKGACVLVLGEDGGRWIVCLDWRTGLSTLPKHQL